MTWLLEMLVPALALSVVAIACLALLANAPSQLRFAFGVAGLAAWVVPWPWLDFSFELPALATLPMAQVGSIAAVNSVLDQIADVRHSVAAERLEPFMIAIIALLVSGCGWFIADCVRLRASIKAWNACSRSGEFLRAQLPAELQSTRARIRIVSGSRVAAASGWINPTIWVGDAFARDADLRLALVHECWHVRRFDQIRIILIAAVKRAYWWNPIVAHLARQSVLMLESACDQRCVRSLGKRHYVERLASMLLETEPCKSPYLVAAARTTSHNVRRLELLNRTVRVRARDGVLIVALSAAGALAAGGRIAQPEAPAVVWSRVAIPATPAGKALAVLFESIDNGDAESAGAYLGAYTPQEVTLPLYDWAGGFELVEILSSERLSVEYVVQHRAGGSRRIGKLQVADAESIQVTASSLQDY